MTPTCILFAGAVGSSKTPIAFYLSSKLGLPMFSNDSIRTETLEDMLIDKDRATYDERREYRLTEVLKSQRNFIYDASVDRRWLHLKETLTENNYKWCLISLNLSKKFLTQLYKTKGYTESLKNIDRYMAEHQKFLNQYRADIDLEIEDKEFADRLELSLRAAQRNLR